jgi:hypothetical protein
MNRRGFLGSILALAAAPAIVRADSLMRIVPVETGALTFGISGIEVPRGLWTVLWQGQEAGWVAERSAYGKWTRDADGAFVPVDSAPRGKKLCVPVGGYGQRR